MSIEKTSIKNRVTALICSGAMAASMVAAPMAAFAAAPEPTATGHTGTGTTDVTVQLNLDPDIDEFGGNRDPNNPKADPGDPDSVGANVAFTTPTKINFISDAQGVLTGPDAEDTYIENKSIFGIHASSFEVESANGWTLVADADEATVDNSVDFQFGVYDENNVDKTEMFDAFNVYSQANHKKAVAKPKLWNMYDKTTASAAADADNKVNLTTTGNIGKVKQDISTQTKMATITTRVSPKLA